MKKKFKFRKSSFKKSKKLHISFTLKGEKGRIPRIVLSVLAALTVIALAFVLFKPEKQLMETPEIKRILSRGVLTVGIRSDMPSFALEGKGLEPALAEKFAKFLLPDVPGDTAVKLIAVSSMTADTKLSDGSVDIVIALMQKDASVKYAYSYSYYTDECRILVLPGDENAEVPEMLIGFVQGTASERTLKTYASEHETKIKTALSDKILKKKHQLPPDAVKFKLKAFASYPDILNALYRGRIDGAVISGAYLLKYKGEIERYGFKLHNEVIGNIEYAITARADEPALAQFADMFIYELQKSGELDALLIKYGLK